MGGHGIEVDVRSTNKPQKGMYSNKKKTDKIGGKTLQKLPDLNQGNQSDTSQHRIMMPNKKPIQAGFASDSDEYMNPQQLPIIKGGNSNAQL